MPDPDTAKSPRFDLYGPIHKALRRFMSETLQRVGALDIGDAGQFAAALDQVDALLGALRRHLRHENDFLHAAIEARQPAGARNTADDHVGHLETIGAIETDVAALRAAPAAEREARSGRLYRHLALFVAENLHHMHIEETANNALLWEHYTDAELIALHDRLVAGIAPDEMSGWLRWMVPSLRPSELAAVLGDLRAKAPPEAFRQVLEIARGALDERRWALLARALGLPQAAAGSPA